MKTIQSFEPGDKVRMKGIHSVFEGVVYSTVSNQWVAVHWNGIQNLGFELSENLVKVESKLKNGLIPEGCENWPCEVKIIPSFASVWEEPNTGFKKYFCSDRCKEAWEDDAARQKWNSQ